jgi:hypothetical protein
VSFRTARATVIAGTALMVCACGGGGGGTRLVSTPPPTPTPTPTPTAAAVKIFPEPTVGEFVSVGVATNLGEWSLAGVPSTTSENAGITNLSSAESSNPAIRYTSNGIYEIRLPGEGYDRLIHDRSIVNPPTGNPYLQLASEPGRYFQLAHSADGFRYSAMGSWWRPDLDFGFTADFGAIAFGMPTPAGAVPVTGQASYHGPVSGWTDIKTFDQGTNSWVLAPVGGTVNLGFDFSKGSFGGSMTLKLPDGMNPMTLGTWSFKETVFSAGSTSYSGKFNTDVAGPNFFLGRFTGPNGQETIGAWALPFVWTTSGETITADGKKHQAFGAWMAKQGN